MKSTWKTIIDIVVSIIAIVAIISLIGMSVAMDIDKPNSKSSCNDCGGQLIYKQAVSHLFSTTVVYECEKCGKIYEVKLQKE